MYPNKAKIAFQLEGTQHFYVLVCFDGKIADPRSSPSAWIIPAIELAPFMHEYAGERIDISRGEVEAKGQHFFHAWHLIIGHNNS